MTTQNNLYRNSFVNHCIKSGAINRESFEKVHHIPDVMYEVYIEHLFFLFEATIVELINYRIVHRAGQKSMSRVTK